MTTLTTEELAAEHAAEHCDDIVMDCPICAEEWVVIAGGER